MKQDFFSCLPQDTIIEILSRLPIRRIIRCKCVCKSWLDLLETREFANSHLSKSTPGLTVIHGLLKFKFFEYVDDNIAHHCSIVFNSIFSLPNHQHELRVHSSANGLLFLSNTKRSSRDYFICNPITRDYIKLPPSSSERNRQFNSYGFGVSTKSGQYKVVRIASECVPGQYFNIWKDKCEVYTLGTGSWRSIAPSSPKIDYYHDTMTTFLNGNLHWLVRDLYWTSTSMTLFISCFDLETEVFSIFSSPLVRGHHSYTTMSALGECLCLCDNSSDDEMAIWLMNEYGDDMSWTKKFIFTKTWSSFHCYGVVYPIKVFEDGDILIAEVYYSRILCYSSKNKTFEKTDLLESGCCYDCNSAVSYTPTFLPLKTFSMENVTSF